MAKEKSKGNGAVDRAAEAVGHALGSVAGTIESLQAQHPHPVEEAREALAAGQETLAAVASKARTRAAAIIKKARAVAGRTKKAAAKAQAKARRKSTPAVAPFPVATMMDIGVARPSAQGQAMMSTATALTIA